MAQTVPGCRAGVWRTRVFLYVKTRSIVLDLDDLSLSDITSLFPFNLSTVGECGRGAFTRVRTL